MLFGRPLCAGVWAPTEVSMTTLVIAGLFLFLTIPGNLLVVLAIVKDSNKNMRTPFCGLVLSLAMTDLVVGILVEPSSMIIHSREISRLSISFSWLSQFTYFLLCTASLLSLTALTIDRYIAITSPFWYRTNATFFRSCMVSVSVWVLAIVFAATFFMVGFISYSFVFANIAVFCSLSILVFGYVRIFRKLKSELAALQSFNDTEQERNRSRQRAAEREKKIANTYLLMIAAFLLTYGPSCIMVYFMNLCTICSCDVIHWLRDMHFVFVTANSFVNPLLYAFRLPNFRSAFLHLLGGLRCNKNNRVTSHQNSVQRELAPVGGLAN